MAENDESDAVVSVVIPTYERPEYLTGAIETARGQTYDNIEIVVVDDGSTESYADETVADYSESVTCVRHEQNKGLSAARNTGIRNATGDYVAFLDDDDRWQKTKIARQVSALEEDDTVGLVTCLVAAITPSGELVHCDRSAPSGDCAREMLINNKIGSPSRVLVDKVCFDDIGVFDESLPTKQDWDFYLRLCQNWNVAAVDDHLCFRTIHESMSSSSVAVERDKTAILKKHEDLIRSNGLWERANASIAEEVGLSYLRDHKLRASRSYFHDSLSVFTTKRVVLTILSYTHPRVVESAITAKRAISKRMSGCDEIDLSKSEIPGLII